MQATRQTNRFMLLFFLYFMAVSLSSLFIPQMNALSDFEYLLVVYLLSFLPPILLYFIVTKKPLKETLRWKWLGWKNLILVVLLGFAIQPLMNFFSFFSGLFFPNTVESTMDSLYSAGFLPVLFATAILPAFFEELLMRGITLSGYRPLGQWKAALCCALLFGMMHLNAQQFLYAFGAGFLLCLLVQRTGSIFASIIPHFIINGATVFAVFFGGTEAALPADYPSTTMLFLSVSLLALLSLPLLAGLLFLLVKNNPAPCIPASFGSDALPKPRFFTPSIVLVCILYLAFTALPLLLS